MRMVLTASSGMRTGETFVIDDGSRLTFGRTTAADNAFDEDGHMSSMHFEVQMDGGRGEVIDRGSTNGTWVNDVRIRREELKEGDLVRAGRTVFEVSFVTGSLSAGDSSPYHGRYSRNSPAVPFQDSPTGDQPRPAGSGRPEADFLPAPSVPAAPVDEPVPRPTPVFPETRRDMPAFVPDEPVVPKPRPVGFESPAAFAGTGHRDPPPPDVRPSNQRPFDSVVEFQTTDHPRPVRPKTKTDLASNPFSESVEVPVPAEAAVPSRPVSVPSEFAGRNWPPGLSRWERVPATDLFETWEYVLQSLARHFALTFVVHFQKIRTGPPSALQPAKPVCDFFGETPEGHSGPVMLDGLALNQSSLVQMMPRLCRADAILVFAGKVSADVERQVRAMMRMGLEGFSEPGGFLPLCWPSGLAGIAGECGTEACVKLFGESIQGAFYCTPGRKPVVAAIAHPPLFELLERTGFQPGN